MRQQFALLALAAGLAAALPSHSAQPAIVGSWYSAEGGYYDLATFLPDGRYFLSSDATGDPQHTGIEWGTWSWNEATGLISATALGDTNGDWGVANDAGGDLYFHVTGDTATVTQAGDPDVGNIARVPVVPGTIIGAWFVDGWDSKASLAFFADGSYLMGAVGVLPGETGIERGRYTWDAATGTTTFFGVVTDTTPASGAAWGDATLVAKVVPGGLLVQSDPGEASYLVVAPERVGEVPEPASWATLLAGAGLLAAALRRRG